ncbi:uncharacterized protein LY89DRAFT_712776 [Mollisia scopiformis]|uniref:Uncharacterized protein n=1 Tax=Mollisia scopiformis TaxID=149040 RepID=A0A194XVN2_MOLSC|nr:uncharacterized protein LY89DRAFT_712776 [Mollisia scopiformis]KUJ23767.1 hypothetical protein LY89DRAFT_712776 [Mollisia scopiformis]
MYAPKNVCDPSSSGMAPARPSGFIIPPPQMAPCKPERKECIKQFRSITDQQWPGMMYKKILNDIEAKNTCRKLVADIDGNREYLQSQLALKGPSIRKRWEELKDSQRETVMKRVDPKMYENKWMEPVLGHKFRYANHSIDCRKDYRNIHLLPYINLQALKEHPSPLLDLFQHRSNFSPAELASFDNRMLDFGWTSGTLDVYFNRNSVTMLGPQFGKLVPWDESAVHSWETVGFPRAHLILAAQHQLLSFLRGMFDALIFDIDRLSIISQTRFALAQDHLSQLQTDPAYMQRYTKLILEAKYDKCATDPYSICAMDLDFDCWSARHWGWIDEEVSKLKMIRSKFESRITPGHSYNLPKPYANRLRALEALIIELLDTLSRHIQITLPHRPGFQHLWDFDFSDPTKIVQRLKCKRTDVAVADAEQYFKDPLNWVISCLATNPNSPGVLDHSRYFEFLEKHLEDCSPKNCPDLAAFNEMHDMLRSHRPRATQSNIAELEFKAKGLEWRYMRKGLMKEGVGDKWGLVLRESSLQEIGMDWGLLGRLLVRFMDQPSLSKGSPLQKLRIFWDELRLQHTGKLRKADFKADDIEYDMSLISADFHPSHMALVEAERKKHLTKSAATKSTTVQLQKPKKSTLVHGQGMVEPVKVPSITTQSRSQKSGKETATFESQTEWGSTPNDIKPTGDTKAKGKTRGIPSAIADDMDALGLDDTRECSAVKVLVKKSAYDILMRLFPNQIQGNQCPPWTSFVDAMSKVKFTSRQNGDSAVTFQPTIGCKWYRQGSITIHRPHPQATIDHVMLLSIGKRTKKWFGWSRETFELEK